MRIWPAEAHNPIASNRKAGPQPKAGEIACAGSKVIQNPPMHCARKIDVLDSVELSFFTNMTARPESTPLDQATTTQRFQCPVPSEGHSSSNSPDMANATSSPTG